MALITQTPVLIDPVAYSRASFDPSNRFGPFRFGSALYLVLQGQNDAIAPFTDNQQLGVFKSTDKGNSWTRQDIPGTPVALDDTMNYASYYPTSENGIISILYQASNAHGTQVVDFDCSTDTFGTPSVALTPSIFTIVSGFGGIQFFKQAGGDYWVFFTRVSAPLGFYYRKLSGGTWSAQTAVDVVAYTSNSGTNTGIINPATGDMLVLAFSFATYPTGLTTKQYLITNSGVVTGPTAAFANFFNQVIMAIWGTSYVVPYTDDQVNLKVAIGTPLAAPVWSISTVDGPYPVNTIPVDPVAFLDKDGNAIVAWIKVNTLDQTANLIYDSTNTGSGWSAPLLVYDSLANPSMVPGFTQSQGAHTLGNGIQLADGNWVFATALDIGNADTGAFPCAGFVLVTAPPSPPVPTLACPIASTAQIGVFFSTMLLASGGTPPYTFAILS